MDPKFASLVEQLDHKHKALLATAAQAVLISLPPLPFASPARRRAT